MEMHIKSIKWFNPFVDPIVPRVGVYAKKNNSKMEKKKLQKADYHSVT